MPTIVQLPKDLVKPALEQALALRNRNSKAATNPVIKEAFEQEAIAIAKAIPLLESTPDLPKK